MCNIGDDIFKEHNKKHNIHYVCDSSEYLSKQTITYLGNKRNLFGLIRQGIHEAQKQLSRKKLVVFDGFSGSGTVSRLLKSYSKSLYVNDLELYSKIISKCYLSNFSHVDIKYIKELTTYLNENKLRDDMGTGFIEELYAPKNNNDIKSGERVFYTIENARILDNIRRMVENESNNYFFIAPLLSEASIHANTAGVFKGFYKNSNTGMGQFGGNNEDCIDRIKGEIHLQIPVFSRYECDVSVYQEDTNILVNKLPELDLAYFDPPYNQHPYGSNYFMLNLIAKYKKPRDISKISGIPKEWNKSSYNIKSKAENSFDNLIKNTEAKFILVSYNNEGFISPGKMKNILGKYGKVQVLEKDYNAFKGSRNLKSRSIIVKEFLFILKK